MNGRQIFHLIDFSLKIYFSASNIQIAPAEPEIMKKMFITQYYEVINDNKRWAFARKRSNFLRAWILSNRDLGSKDERQYCEVSLKL